MKKIEAILRREKLREVMNALEQAHCPGIMICDIEGYGRAKKGLRNSSGDGKCR